MSSWLEKQSKHDFNTKNMFKWNAVIPRPGMDVANKSCKGVAASYESTNRIERILLQIRDSSQCFVVRCSKTKPLKSGIEQFLLVP